MDNSRVFTIDGRSFNNVRIIEFSTAYEILDGEDTDRTQGDGWPMVRAPEGTIVNINKITFGSTTSANPDFKALIKAIASFGVNDFKPVRFMSPLGVIEQDMYCGGSVSVDLERVELDINGEDVTLWGTLSTKFTAREAYYTPDNTRGL